MPSNKARQKRKQVMNKTTIQILKDIAAMGLSVIMTATERKAAEELTKTGLFKIEPKTIAGVDCDVIKLDA